MLSHGQINSIRVPISPTILEVNYVLDRLKSRSLVKRQLYTVMFLHEFIRHQYTDPSKQPILSEQHRF